MPSKSTSYREMPVEELQAAYVEANEQLFKLRQQQALGQLEKPSQIRTVRRSIARMMTIINERARTPAGVQGA